MIKKKYIEPIDPDACDCPQCGHSASGVRVNMDPPREFPHTCCGHPDCMVSEDYYSYLEDEPEVPSGGPD
jgi:hypothetical protein